MLGLFFIYSLKVALCLMAFYLLHKLLLSQEKLHVFNRATLLCIVLLSLAIPCIKVALHEPNMVNEGMVIVEELIVSAEVVTETEQTGLSLLQVMFLIYISGVAVFIVRDAISLLRLRSLIKRSKVTERRDGAVIMVIEEDIAPFSWFRYIILSRKDYEENPREIIIHEMAHMRLYHSADILLCNLLIILQWFNPAAWLLRRELQDVHEFEADEAVINEGVDAKQYQLLLIRKSVGERLFSMANNLNHNSLKRRIKMMKTKNSNRWQCAKALAVIPVAAVAIVAFASPKAEQVAQKVAAESEEIVKSVADDMMQTESQAEIIATADNSSMPEAEPMPVEEQPVATEKSETAAPDNSMDDDKKPTKTQMPSFPGGQKAMMQYLAENVKYPENARKNGKSGRVIVQFIVEKDGSITETKVIKSIDPELDAEALRIVNGMPKWTPAIQDGKTVRIKFFMPIVFSDGESHKKEKKTQTTSIDVKGGVMKINDETITKNADEIVVIGTDPEWKAQPVFVCDGKVITSAEFKKISPDKIESVTVNKDEATIEKYGAKGKDGVIVITLKK